MRFLAVLVASASLAGAAETAPLQLKGVLDTGGDRLFGLATESGDRSAWVSLGQKFGEYSLKSYDETKSLLVLESAGKTYELSLDKAKIRTAETPNVRPATVAEAAAVIDRMRFDETLTKMLEIQKGLMLKMSIQNMRRMGVKATDKEIEEFQGKVMDLLAKAINPSQMKQEMSQVYAQLFSQDELRALNDFYSTPTGQAMIDKGPAVGQKLQELMMPRIMAASPDIQKLNMEFVRAHQPANLTPPMMVPGSSGGPVPVPSGTSSGGPMPLPPPNQSAPTAAPHN